MKNPKLLIGGGLLLATLVAGGIFAATGGMNKIFPTATPSITPTQSTSQDTSKNNNDSSNNDSSSSDASDLNDDCRLLTSSEASAVLGSPAKAKTETSTSGCTYTTDSIEKFGIIVYDVSSLSGESKLYYEQGIMALVETDFEIIPVSGAEKAYWLPSIFQLHVLLNDKLIIVSIVSDEVTGQEKEAMVSIASKIIGRL